MSRIGTQRTAGSERGTRTGPPRRTRDATDEKAHAAQTRDRQLATAEQANSDVNLEAEMLRLGVSPRRNAIARALLLADVVALTVAYAAALQAGIGSSASTTTKVEAFVLVLLCGTLLSRAYG